MIFLFIDYVRIYSYFFFVVQLVGAMGDARSQDTNILWYELLKYIPLQDGIQDDPT